MKLKRKIKKGINSLIKPGLFFIANRVYSAFLPIDTNKVLFASDDRKEMGGNMEFVRNALPEGLKPVYHFRADRRDKRTFSDIMSVIRDMSTSRYIILEDYYKYTSFQKVRPGQEICQLWHAAGAYKKFGFSREGNSEHIRIHPGYRKYAKAITSSDFIRKNYAEAFDISIDKVHATGVPRTDIFFDKDYVEKTKAQIYEEYPILKEKKVIMFAPTYRGRRAHDAAYDFEMIDPEFLYKNLSDEYVFVFKWHPATYNNLRREEKEMYHVEEFGDFFMDLSKARDINDLLLVTDVLITDYSSVIFDYLLVNKPVVYYAYDLEDYQGGRGLYYDFEDYCYGRVARSIDELITAVRAEDLCEEKRSEFRRKFMEACDGHATEKTVEYIFGEYIKEHEAKSEEPKPEESK